jgi:hypothetical protein
MGPRDAPGENVCGPDRTSPIRLSLAEENERLPASTLPDRVHRLDAPVAALQLIAPSPFRSLRRLPCERTVCEAAREIDNSLSSLKIEFAQARFI